MSVAVRGPFGTRSWASAPTLAVTSASITKSVSNSAIARRGSSALLAVSMSLLASSSRSILSLAIRLLAPSVKVGILPLEPAAAGLSRP